MANVKDAITHMQIMNTWASFASEHREIFLSDVHMMSIKKWTEEVIDLLKCQDEKSQEVCANCHMDPVKPSWHQGKAYCGACGKRIPQKIGAHYCHKCGRKVAW